MTATGLSYRGPLFPEGDEVLATEQFLDALDAMPPGDRWRVLKQVQFLVHNRYHPSLRLHPLHSIDGAWDCYVSDRLRMVVGFDNSRVRLWYVGQHDIIDHTSRTGLYPRARFRPLPLPPPDPRADDPGPTPARGAAAERAPLRDREPGPFAAVPEAHLRILGVPRAMVSPVRRASLEELAGLDGLPAHTRQWLLEIATSPPGDGLTEPSRLVYRTTLDRLTGYCKGKIRRLMLNLNPDQERCVRLPEGTYLVRGCAGSGKTTVGLYRAIERAGRGERVLVLTFNRTLAQAIRTLIEDHCGLPWPPEITVKTVLETVVQLLHNRGVHLPPIIGEEAARRLLNKALAAAQAKLPHPVLGHAPGFFREEFERVIKGGDLPGLEPYLEVERFGRKTALGPAGRRAVWRVFEIYQGLLAQEEAVEWADLPLLLLRDFEAAGPPEPYANVVVDEAQDLTVAQIQVIRRLAGGEDGPSLMLLGDAAQTIYSRGYSWKQAGLHVRGRVFSLTRNHRNTRQIAEAADGLLQQNELFRQSGEYVQPERTTREGPAPIVLRCAPGHQPPRAVVERILDLVEDQLFRPSDIAILCPTRALRQLYAEACAAASLPYQCYNPEEAAGRTFELLEDKVKVLTIHAAKGIEFPVVFVAGVTREVLPRLEAIRLWDEEEDRLLELERQRTLLYVGMTRAAECLFLVTEAGRESPFLREIEGFTRVEPYPPEMAAP